MIRQWLPNKEMIWNFGPFTFLGIPRWLARTVRDWSVAWEMVPLFTILLLQVGELAFERALPDRWLFGIHLAGPLAVTAHLLATTMCVAVPLKILMSSIQPGLAASGRAEEVEWGSECLHSASLGGDHHSGAFSL